MHELTLGHRLLRAVGTTSTVFAIVLGSLVGLNDWADATATNLSAPVHHASGVRN